MSGTKYIASNWRVPENSNSSKNDNYSLSFDPSGDYLTFPSAGDLFGNNEKFSFSFWCKVETMAAFKVFFDFSPNNFGLLALRTLNTSTIELLKSGSSLGTHTFSDTTDFHHFCIVYDKTNIKLFIDTAEVISSAQTNMGNFTGLDLYLGNGYFLTSGIDAIFSEASIFNYDLSSPQISTLYGNATSGAGNPMALKPTPIAYYPLGDNSSGDPVTQPNVSVDDASVFEFTGVNGVYVDAGNDDSINFTSAFSVGFWFKTTSSAVMYTSHGANSDIKYYIQWYAPINRLRLQIYDGTGAVLQFDNTQVFNDNKWHHLAFTTDGTTAADKVIMYFDGQPLSTTGTLPNNGIKSTAGSLKIGAYVTTQNTFDGQLSNFQTWNTELTSSEVTTLYNSGVPLTGTQPQASSLRAWYKLDQSANWEADTLGNWQIPDAVSAYPQSFDVPGATNALIDGGNNFFTPYITSPNRWPIGTISFWLNTSETGYNGLFNFGGGWLLRFDNQAAQRFFWTTGSGTNYIAWSGVTIADSKWHHIALVIPSGSDKTQAKLYIDNQEISVAITAGSNDGTGINMESIRLGTDQVFAGSGNRFSNFTFHNIAFDSVQIEALYNNGTPLTTQIETANLKGWWKLDDTATFSTNWTVSDASGNGNNGTSANMTEQSLVNNNVSTLNGESSGMTSGNLVLSDLTRNLPYENYSLNFDSGSSEDIDCGDSDTFSFGNGTTDSPFSISAWIKPSLIGVTFHILNKENNTTTGDEYLLYIASTNVLRFVICDQNFLGDRQGRTTSALTAAEIDNVWCHIAVTYDGRGGSTASDGINIYVNGVNRTSGTFNLGSYTAMHNTTSSVKIGGYSSGVYSNGKISNTSIFNVELTPTEVLKLYANGLPQDLTNFTPQPISWWTLGKESFWNGSDWIVRDMIGSNDGTSANMGVDSLVGDAPRSEANGTGTNMDIPTNLVGNAGFSDKNAYSINMSPSARVTDTP